jgi:O-antigen/teichoic acid export membrane protein
LRRLRQLRTLSLYFAIPALNAATPLIVLPALTLMYGAPGLASIAIGQSLGASAAVIAELGWGVLGPQLVARADAKLRSELYASALATKLSAVVVMTPIAFVAAYLLTPEHKLAAGCIAVGFSVVALSPTWYLVGLNRPLAILLVEALPRLILLTICALVILSGGPLELYGLFLVGAAAATWVLATFATKQNMWPSVSAFVGGPSVIRRQLPLTGGRVISVLYTSLPVTIVAIVSPNSTATFAALDRLVRMAGGLLGGVPSRLQSWIGAGQGDDRVQRSRRSLVFNSIFGLLAGCGFTVSAPLVAQLVFSGVVELSAEISILGGSVVFAICASRGFGLSLVAEGLANWIALANVAAAIVGVVSVYSLTHLLGAEGAVMGNLAAEFVGLLVQAVILISAHHRLTAQRQSGQNASQR